MLYDLDVRVNVILAYIEDKSHDIGVALSRCAVQRSLPSLVRLINQLGRIVRPQQGDKLGDVSVPCSRREALHELGLLFDCLRLNVLAFEEFTGNIIPPEAQPAPLYQLRHTTHYLQLGKPSRKDSLSALKYWK